MSFGPTSPLTGGPQTGFTSPTYTLTSDPAGAPNSHSIQYVVTALGGTQTGVDVNSVSSPFSITAERPSAFRQLGAPNPVTGVIANVPFNVWKYRVRKGLTPLSGQPVRIGSVEIKISVPAGADTADDANVRAMLSAAFGLAWDSSADIGDSCIDGTL